VDREQFSASASVTGVLDTTAPRLVIEAPADRSSVAAASIPVAGMVNDIVSGIVNADDVTVTVNGVNAAIADGTFLASAVPLQVGANTLTATATDTAGNAAS